MWASNFSLGVAVLTDLVERAAAALPGWDVDIVEAHHTQKKDAPSGTALTLGEAAAGRRRQVSYASLRAGDIVGEHTVQFTGLGERMELVHRAGNRDIFARGALHAAARIVGQARRRPTGCAICWTEPRAARFGAESEKRLAPRDPVARTIPARLLPTATDRRNTEFAVSCSRKLEGQGSFTPRRTQ